MWNKSLWLSQRIALGEFPSSAQEGNLGQTHNIPWDEEACLIDQQEQDTKFHGAKYQREEVFREKTLKICMKILFSIKQNMINWCIWWNYHRLRKKITQMLEGIRTGTHTGLRIIPVTKSHTRALGRGFRTLLPQMWKIIIPRLNATLVLPNKY